MRNVFFLPFGGVEAFRHYQDTIARKRTFAEAEKFIDGSDVLSLKALYHGRGFAVWGARGTSGNERVYAKMSPGDYVVFTGEGRAKLVGEVSYLVRSPGFAEHLWGMNQAQETWENIYFIINEREIDVPLPELNRLVGYAENFRPQGLMGIDQEKLAIFTRHYGDISDVLLQLDRGAEIREKDAAVQERQALEAPAETEPRTTEHTEMQWRLIRLAQAAGNDAWVPRGDQGRQFEGHDFKETVLSEFAPGLDVPKTIENIDVVWKYGRNNITSAFEIENSTSIYSGILRLSDLLVEAPNSSYPLFIVAADDKREKVFDQLKRPTFSTYGLKLDQKVGYLSYDRVRELDAEFGGKEESGLTPEKIIHAAEMVTVNS